MIRCVCVCVCVCSAMSDFFVSLWTTARQASLSMGFSRQGYWSVLPFPTPGDLPKPGIAPRSPVLQADSLPVEPQGKPKNTGVGSLSLFQWIFLTQGLNPGLLYCRQILYHLSQQESPDIGYNKSLFDYLAGQQGRLSWVT